MEVINLTNHLIRYRLLDGSVASHRPSGTIARLDFKARETIAGYDFPCLGPEPINGLPQPQEGVIYIVSTLVRLSANRPDVFSPDTASALSRLHRRQLWQPSKPEDLIVPALVRSI